MAKLKGELQADNGDVLYPHTSSDVVFSKNGKSIEEQINVLNSDRGYINSKDMKDFNACVKNGKYTVYFNGDGVAQHAPPNIWTGDNTFTVDVTQQNDAVLVQEICGIYGPNQGRKFYRVNTFSKWTDWKEVANTSKIDISLVSQWTKGIGDMNQYISKNGNTVTVNVSIKGGISNENTVIFTLPDGFKPNSNVVIAGAKNWSKDEVARFITVRTNGEVVLRRGFNSSDTYILDFSFSIN